MHTDLGSCKSIHAKKKQQHCKNVGAKLVRCGKSDQKTWLPLLVVLVTGATLVYGTLDMPNYGDPQAPVHQHVAPRYIEKSLEETSVPNMVTAVLASYRGYDTLGEVTVIFTAGIGVMVLLSRLRIGRRKEDEDVV